MYKKALAAIILTSGLLAAQAQAAEEWRVARDGADGWGFDKSGLAKNEQTGFVHLQIGRFYSSGQVDGSEAYQFEIRRYQVNCETNRTRQLSSERYAANGRAVSAKPADPAAPWVPASFGWPLKAKSFACDASSGQSGTAAPGKIAAMALMKTLVEAQTGPTSAAAPAPAATELCKTVRKVLGDGQKEKPFFSSFYASVAERGKYAGLGSTTLEGFGACRIQQTNTPPGRLSPVFASYYCEKTGGSKEENARFAAEISSRISACLQTGTLSEGTEMGHSIKTYEHAVTMSGFPRVRIQHTDTGVTIYLDTQGL